MTDLAAGTWQVWREGKILRPAVRVAETEGMMYFEVPPGRDQLGGWGRRFRLPIRPRLGRRLMFGDNE